MDPHIDYSYALNFLKRLNAFIEAEPRLRKRFIYKNWNILQAYQALIFGDMKYWSKENDISAIIPKKSLILSLKTFLVSIAVIFISLVSAVYAILARKKFVIFSGDKTDGSYKNDFRLETLYASLDESGSTFIEVVHTLGNRQTIKNFFRRKRAVIYLESIDLLLAPLVALKRREARRIILETDLTSFDAKESSFVRFELEKYLSFILVTKARYRILGLFLKLLSAKAVFSIDDTRHYNELMAAARSAGVKSYALQHGHFTKYHPGWLEETSLPGEVMRPETLVVWSEYWMNELKRLGTYFKDQELMVGGERWDLPWIPAEAGEKIHILFPYEKDAPKSEVKEYIKKFMKVSNVKVVFKIRADQDKQTQLREYDLLPIAESIIIIRSMRDLLPEVSMALGTYSTFLYDMVTEGKPVAILETSIDYGEGMVKSGLAEYIRKDDEPSIIIEKIKSISETELRRRREMLVGREPLMLKDTLRGIIKSHANTP